MVHAKLSIQYHLPPAVAGETGVIRVYIDKVYAESPEALDLEIYRITTSEQRIADALGSNAHGMANVYVTRVSD